MATGGECFPTLTVSFVRLVLLSCVGKVTTRLNLHFADPPCESCVVVV